MKKCDVGGQAVIEGVMMRGKKGTATAVRTPNGEIEVDISHTEPLIKKYKFLNIPFLRGIIILVESLLMGVKTLNYSASFFEEDTESGFDIWLKEKLGDKGASNLIATVSMTISLIMAIVIFAAIPTGIATLFKKFGFNNVALNVVESIIRISILATYMFLISKIDEIYRVFQYHGAEHKVIACYEADEKLIVENVRKYSRYHARCGTNFLFLTMIVSVIMFSVTGWGNFIQRLGLRIILMPLIAGITYEIIKWLGRNGENKLAKIIAYPGIKLQELTTKEPDDSQIEVAIEALLKAEGIEYKKTIGELLLQGNEILKSKGIETYILDTQVLLGKALKKDKIYLLTNKEEIVGKTEQNIYKHFLKLRAKNMPVKYIIKTAEFMGIDFYVERGVLIPRPDTEILVEEVLKEFDKEEVIDICDLCTGSGAIGISLAILRENINVDLVDYYEKPERISNINIRNHNLKDRVNFIKSDLLETIIGENKKYDILVSNPPYIKEKVIDTLMVDVKDYEPHEALSGGDDGLDFYKKIVNQSIEVLKENGILAFEIGHDQGIEVKELLEKKGYYNVRVVKDLAGLDRVVLGKL